MTELVFKIIDKNNITKEVGQLFINQLKKQGKVVEPSIAKIQSCRQLILCYCDKNLIGISALKTKTKSDFSIKKSGLTEVEKKFEWELGYFYVEPEFRKLGIASTMTRLLLNAKENESFLASTELYASNGMIYILEKFGFRQYGKPWNSTQHNGTLGLFLKYKAGE